MKKLLKKTIAILLSIVIALPVLAVSLFADNTSISSAAISGIQNRAFTGNDITLNITVRIDSTTLRNGTDYTVSYKNNRNVGQASVTITGSGNYTGIVTRSFNIVPRTPVIRCSVSQGKIRVDVAANASADRFDILASTERDGTYRLLGRVNAVSGKNVTFTSNAMRAGTYYIKVRAVKTVDGRAFNSSLTQPSEVRVSAPSAPVSPPTPTPAPTSVAPANSIFPITYRAFSKEFTITGYSMRKNEDGKTEIILYGQGSDISFESRGRKFEPVQSLISAEFGFGEVDGEITIFNQATVNIFNTSAMPEIITLINNETGAVIVTFNVSDVPQM